MFRSPDRGLTWTPISPDLTTNQNRDEIVTMGVKGSEIAIARNDGIQAWPTIVSLAESPKTAGLLYAGTDDGQLAGDARRREDLDAGHRQAVRACPRASTCPKWSPSRFDEGTVYATFDGHRQNDFGTYIYASNDFGQTWRPIMNNLKDEVARTLTEDQKNPDVLYLGDRDGPVPERSIAAKSWQRLQARTCRRCASTRSRCTRATTR